MVWNAARLLLATLLVVILCHLAHAQGGYNDDRVMIQGFMWESHQSGPQTAEGGLPYEVDWQGKWYDHVRSNVDELADAKFDLIWLPSGSMAQRCTAKLIRV